MADAEVVYGEWVIRGTMKKGAKVWMMRARGMRLRD